MGPRRAAADENLAYQLAAAAAAELCELGLNLNFASCADVNTNPRNPVIGTRSYGSDPGRVAGLVAATVRGYQDHGVLATAKHFPGHGDTHQDSHFTLPRLVRDRAALTGLLRGELGFEGLVLTDCLEMRAILDHCGAAQAMLEALAAGADLTLWSHTPAYQEAAVAAAGSVLVGNGPVEAGIVRRAVSRVRRVREGLQGALRGQEAKSASAPSAAAVQAVYRRSTVLVAAQPGVLPLAPGARVLLAGTGDPASPLGEMTAARGTGAGFAMSGAAQELQSQLRARGVDAVAMPAPTPAPAGVPVVLLTRSACADEKQLEAARGVAALASGPVVHVATGLRYDLGLVTRAGTHLATFDEGTGAMMVLAEVLAGERPAAGRLPVAL